MASRRMFSFRVTESTRFLKMPATSQNLYFHLCMHADDDGVVEAYNVIRLLGANEDDLRVIVSKGFATLLNEDMVTYINDWRENNNIRADRKTDSVYQELLLSVIPDADLVESKTSYYARKKEICQTNDRQTADNCQPIDRIGKDRLGKDRLGKDRLGKDRLDKDNINYQLIADMYNNTCVSFPRLTKLSDARKKAIKARLNQYSIEDFQRLFQMAEESSFLKGQNDRNWSATFDWLVKDANMAKVLDGNYSSGSSKQQPERTKYNNDFSDYVQELMTGKEVAEDEPFK